MSSYCEQFRPYALTSNLVTCKPQAAKGQKWPATKPAGHRANLCKSCFQELVAAHCRSSHFKTGNSERSSARHSILIGCPQILNISQYRIPTCVSTYINTFSSSQHREVPGQLDNWPGKQRHKDSARNTKPLTAVKWKYVEASERQRDTAQRETESASERERESARARARGRGVGRGVGREGNASDMLLNFNGRGF